MFSALSRWWQRQLRSGRASRPPRRSRGGFRPRLEALEDRYVLSTLTVTGNGDDFTQVGTLRWAVANAHNGDTIQITPDNGAGRHITLTQGELFLNQNVTIKSIGATATIDGNNSSRIFEIDPSANVSLLGLKIINGDGIAHNPLGKHNFTALDVPEGTGTSANGINNSGQVVGIYGGTYAGAYGYHSYVLSGGSYTTLDVPGATNWGLAAFTWAYGINDSGQVVGFYGKDGTLHGFVYSGGSYTTLDVPGATGGTEAQEINDFGQVVGSYGDATGIHGFVYDGGSYTTLDVPGAIYTQAFGINGNGQIVGAYLDASYNQHGFVLSGGSYTTLDVPGATFGTFAYGINDSGQIVGFYQNASAQHGFVYGGGSYATLEVPGALPGLTDANGINDSGQIVGRYEAPGGPNGAHLSGFLATSADGDGGGIRNEGTLYLNQCDVGSNMANGVNVGGGMYNDHGTLVVTSSTVQYNVAGTGGGMYNDHGNLVLTSSAVQYNVADHGGFYHGGGGGIYNDHGTLVITAPSNGTSVLRFNTVEGVIADGGAINSDGGFVGVSNSLLDDNTANGVGGGIADHLSTVAVSNSQLNFNSAYWGGGGISNDHGALTVTDSQLVANSTSHSGGGIDDSFGTVQVTGSELVGNSAGDVGGGIDDYSGTVTVTGSHLLANSASIAGGGIGTLLGTVVVTGSELVANSALYGGAIDNGGGTVKVGTTLFEVNTVDDIKGLYTDLGGNTFM
jgi:probable HAF family extracellular repeat protein